MFVGFICYPKVNYILSTISVLKFTNYCGNKSIFNRYLLKSTSFVRKN